MYRQKSISLFLLFFWFLSGLNSANVLLFNQDCNVDAAGADNTCADERYNLLNILNANGHSVSLLPDFHQGNMAMILSSHDFFMLPDIEDQANCDISSGSFITASEKLVLKNYVENGGSLLTVGSAHNVNFINDIFGLGLSVSQVVNTGMSIKNEAEAVGTPFAGCTPSISNISATFLITSSIPSNKKCIYTFGGNASIAFFKVGQGSVTYVGFDYHDAGPGCSQSASEWVGCTLEAGVEAATFGILGKPAEVPSLSQWGIIILSISLCIVGILSIRSEPLAFYINNQE